MFASLHVPACPIATRACDPRAIRSPSCSCLRPSRACTSDHLRAGLVERTERRRPMRPRPGCGVCRSCLSAPSNTAVDRDLRACVMDAFAGPDAVIVVDETGDLKKGVKSRTCTAAPAHLVNGRCQGGTYNCAQVQAEFKIRNIRLRVWQRPFGSAAGSVRSSLRRACVCEAR